MQRSSPGTRSLIQYLQSIYDHLRDTKINKMQLPWKFSQYPGGEWQICKPLTKIPMMSTEGPQLTTVRVVIFFYFMMIQKWCTFIEIWILIFFHGFNMWYDTPVPLGSGSEPPLLARPTITRVNSGYSTVCGTASIFFFVCLGFFGGSVVILYSEHV